MLIRWRQQFAATFFDSSRKQDLFPALGAVIFLFLLFRGTVIQKLQKLAGISGFLAEISDVSSCRTLWWNRCHRYPKRFQCIRHFLLLIRSLIFFNLWSFLIEVLSFAVLFLLHLLYICFLDGIWSSGWKESWEGLLVVSYFSTSWAEAIFRVKWRLEIQTNVVMLWSLLWLVAETVMWLAVRMVSGDWCITIRFVSEVRSGL